MKSLLGKLAKRVLFEPPSLKLLRKHAEKVQATLEKLIESIGDYAAGREIDYERISHLEYEADLAKQEIRSSLPRSDLFLPVARSDLLEFLWQQDKIADNCQDAAGLLALMRVELTPQMEAKFRELAEILRKGTREYASLIEKMGEVLESSPTPERVRELWNLIDKLNLIEHEADLAEMALIKMAYAAEDMDSFQRYHLVQIALKLGSIADHMQNAGGRLRIMTARWH